MPEVYWCSHCEDKAVGCHVLAESRQTAQRCYSLETGTDFFLVQTEKSQIYKHENKYGSKQEDITEPLVMFSAGASRDGGENHIEFTAVSKEKKNLFFVAVNTDKDIGDNAVVFYLYNSISESCLQIITELYSISRKTIRCSPDLEWKFSLVPSNVNGEWRLTIAVDYRGRKDKVAVILSE